MFAGFIPCMKAWAAAYGSGVAWGTVIGAIGAIGLSLVGIYSRINTVGPKPPVTQPPPHAHWLIVNVTVTRPLLVQTLWVETGRGQERCELDARLIEPATNDANCSVWIDVRVNVEHLKFKVEFRQGEVGKAARAASGFLERVSADELHKRTRSFDLYLEAGEDNHLTAEVPIRIKIKLEHPKPHSP